MTDEKKPRVKSVQKPDKALALLQQAHDVLVDIGGKDAAVWQTIAGRVQTTIGYVEKYK